MVIDRFDSLTLGALNGQNGWYGDTSGLFVVQDSVAQGGSGKAISHVEGSGVNDKYVIKDIQLTPNGRISFYLRTTSDASQSFIMFRELQSGTLWPRFGVRLWNGNMQYYGPGWSWYNIGSGYGLNTWHKVIIEWKLATHKARYKINAGAWSAWQNGLSDLVNGITAVQLYNYGGSGGTVYWDSIVLLQPFAVSLKNDIGEFERAMYSQNPLTLTEAGIYPSSIAGGSAASTYNCISSSAAMTLPSTLTGCLTRSISNALACAIARYYPLAISSQMTQTAVNLSGYECVECINAPCIPDIAQFLNYPFLPELVQVLRMDILEKKNIVQTLSSMLVNSDTNIVQTISNALTDGLPAHIHTAIHAGLLKPQLLNGQISGSDVRLGQILRASIGEAASQIVSTLITQGHFRALHNLSSIMEDFTLAQVLATGIDDKTGSVRQVLRWDILQKIVRRQAVQWDIRLDGRSIKGQVNEINLIRRELDIINHIEIQAALSLYEDIPGPREALRIELIIADITYQFYLETTERQEEFPGGSITIWGRQQPARLAEGFADKLQQTFTNLWASEIAAQLADQIPLTWEAPDYWVPAFSIVGYPLEAISELACAAGAILRTLPDGSLTVRPRFIVAPMVLSSAEVSVQYDRSNIKTLQESGQESLFSAVTVDIQPSATDDTQYTIETDDICLEPGGVRQARVYGAINMAYSLCITPPGQAILKSKTAQKQIKETLELKDGRGSTGRPVYEVMDYGLVECADIRSTLTWNVGQTEVVLPAGRCALLTITYLTYYDLWEVSSPQAGDVLACVYAEAAAGLAGSVRVVMGNGLQEGQRISNNLVFSESQGRIAGQAYLYDNYYRQRRLSLETPWQGVYDGMIAAINDERFNVYGAGIIRVADLFISQDNGAVIITEKVEVVMYETDNRL